MNQNAATSSLEALHEDVPALLAGTISWEHLPPPIEALQSTQAMEKLEALSEEESVQYLAHHGYTPETWAEKVDELLPTK